MESVNSSSCRFFPFFTLSLHHLNWPFNTAQRSLDTWSPQSPEKALKGRSKLQQAGLADKVKGTPHSGEKPSDNQMQKPLWSVRIYLRLVLHRGSKEGNNRRLGEGANIGVAVALD